MRERVIRGSIAVLLLCGCQPTHQPSVADTMFVGHENDLSIRMQQMARANAPADAVRHQNERDAISALRTVNIGDTYETFQQKTAAARINKRQVVSNGFGRSERYVLIDNDSKSFTLYVKGGKVSDFVAVGFDMGK